jgi:hypothetical protein
LTGAFVAPILSEMWWSRYLGRDRTEDTIARLRERLAPQPEADDASEDLRLFPIVGRDLCYPVAALLSRGKLEEAGRLVSQRAWVASTPLYG